MKINNRVQIPIYEFSEAEKSSAVEFYNDPSAARHAEELTNYKILQQMDDFAFVLECAIKKPDHPSAIRLRTALREFLHL